MRHLIVDRIVWLLAAAWLGAVLLFGWAATRPPPALPVSAELAERVEPAAGPSGETLFAQHCARCHGLDEAAAGLRDAPDREAEAAALREFLRRHYGPSPEGNALIVNHLLESFAR
jgi:mono/diheme cytochrome c family protein